jgi:hypothetical protein
VVLCSRGSQTILDNSGLSIFYSATQQLVLAHTCCSAGLTVQPLHFLISRCSGDLIVLEASKPI